MKKTYSESYISHLCILLLHSISSITCGQLELLMINTFKASYTFPKQFNVCPIDIEHTNDLVTQKDPKSILQN